jgi:hypothetical protein
LEASRRVSSVVGLERSSVVVLEPNSRERRGLPVNSVEKLVDLVVQNALRRRVAHGLRRAESLRGMSADELGDQLDAELD